MSQYHGIPSDHSNVPGAIAAISAATHGGFRQSSSQSPSCVFLCLKSGYLSFVYNQKSRSSRSAMYSPHPRHNWHHKNREICIDLLHQHIAITYLLQPTTNIPPVQRTSNEFLPRLDQDSNQERVTRLTTRRAMVPSTCEL